MMTLGELNKFLSYDAITGEFTWLVKRQSFAGMAKVGSRAGSINGGICGGYLMITLNRKKYRAHRLAWLSVTGSFPPEDKHVDHINGIRTDNRWSNLRLVTRCQNQFNRNFLNSNNKSGVKGVSWDSGRNLWTSRITVNKRIICLGRREDFNEAVALRKAAEEKYTKHLYQ